MAAATAAHRRTSTEREGRWWSRERSVTEQWEWECLGCGAPSRLEFDV